MNYELAKELQAAGFPVKFKERQPEFAVDPIIEIPTVEEMIEVLGGKNLRLMADYIGNWSASSFIYAKHGEGATPREALARLYLALKKQ